MLDKIKEFLISLLSDSNGNISSMRIIATLIVITSLFNWTYGCIAAGTLVAMDWKSIALIISALTAKSVQKGIEEKKKK